MNAQNPQGVNPQDQNIKVVFSDEQSKVGQHSQVSLRLQVTNL